MLTALTIILVVGSVSSQSSQKPPQATRDVEEQLAKQPHFSMILDLLRTAGLLDDLKNAPQLTLFAPTNTALSSLSSSEYAALKADSGKLQDLLKYHATTDAIWNANFASNDKVFNSLNNLPIRVNAYRLLHTYAAEGVNVTDKNLRITNGVIQGIEGVMQPPKGDIIDIINNTPELSILAGLIRSSGLEAVIKADQNITLLAPNNNAFSQLNPSVLTYLQNSPELLKHVLLYHVVPRTTLYSIGMRHQMLYNTATKRHDQLMLIENGDDIFANNAKVVSKDISATNGVIHVLGDVLLPTDTLVKLEDLGFGHQTIG